MDSQWDPGIFDCSSKVVKDAPLEHPPLVHGNKGCTDVVNINVKVMMQVHECKSRQPLLRQPVSEM